MKFRKTTLTLVMVLLISLVLGACGGKEADSLKRVKDSGELVVVGSGGYPPFNFIADDGSVIGFDVDTGEEIAKRLGVELKYETSDWDGLTEGLRNARYDAILGSMAITDKRLEVVNFTEPYYYSGAQLFVRADSGITDPSDMEGKSIAVATGTNFVGDAEELGATPELYADDTATLTELINGRVDGVITDRLVGIQAIEALEGGDQITMAGEILRLESMGIAINKDDDTLLAEIDKILAEMHEDGTMKAISEEWHNGVNITVK